MAAQFPLETHMVCSVPFFTTQLREFDAQRRASFTRMILALQSRSPGIAVSNRYGWHSENNLHLAAGDDVKWFHQQLNPFLRASLSTLGAEHAAANILMTSCWANVSGFKAWNEPHCHLPSHWSGVFYVSAEDSLARDHSGDKSGCIEFLNPLPLGKPYGLHQSFTVQPRDGMALLFPGFLMHYVHPNHSDKTRISIAFNVDLEFVPPARA